MDVILLLPFFEFDHLSRKEVDFVFENIHKLRRKDILNFNIENIPFVTRLLVVEKSGDSSATRCTRFLRVQCKEVCRLVAGSMQRADSCRIGKRKESVFAFAGKEALL